MSINAHQYLEEELDKYVKYTTDVPFRDIVEICIDILQHGVGGNTSWGASVHSKYRLLDKEYEYSYTIKPLIGNKMPKTVFE